MDNLIAIIIVSAIIIVMMYIGFYLMIKDCMETIMVS